MTGSETILNAINYLCEVKPPLDTEADHWWWVGCRDGIHLLKQKYFELIPPDTPRQKELKF